MDETFFKKLHDLKHEDEMRSKVLLYSVQYILAEKKEQGFIHKWFKSKKKMVAAKWN